jgi:hypothetical protein
MRQLPQERCLRESSPWFDAVAAPTGRQFSAAAVKPMLFGPSIETRRAVIGLLDECKQTFHLGAQIQ